MVSVLKCECPAAPGALDWCGAGSANGCKTSTVVGAVCSDSLRHWQTEFQQTAPMPGWRMRFQGRRACEDHLMPAVSVQHGNGVLAKAEALAEAKTAHTIRSRRGSMAKWDKPSSCWFDQQ